MSINKDEKCAICGLPRHAHWGDRPLAAGRCSGFERHKKTIDLESIRAAVTAYNDDLNQREAAPTADDYNAILAIILTVAPN